MPFGIRIRVSLKQVACLTVALVALAPFLSGLWVAAAATTGGVSLGVDPLRIPLTLGPGQSSQGEIEVSNEGAAAITVKAYIMDRVTKSSGQIRFIEPGTNRWSAGRWITLTAESVAIGPKKAAKVGWRVDVPRDVEPGEHSAVVFFEPVRETTQAERFTFAARIGAVISVEVPGQIRTEGRLIGFTAEQPPVRINLGPLRASFKLPFGLFDGGPVPFAAAFENTGNVRVEATSKVEIKTRSGRTVATIASEDPVTIFPDDSWNVSAVWDKPPTFGRFLAEVRVKYADGRPELIAATAFSVFPVRQSLALAVFAAGIWFIRGGVTALVQRRRRRKGERAQSKHPPAAGPAPPSPVPGETAPAAAPAENPPLAAAATGADRPTAEMTEERAETKAPQAPEAQSTPPPEPAEPGQAGKISPAEPTVPENPETASPLGSRRDRKKK
ncbi:MAG: hypothetical protein ACYC41_10790 [Bacillota bacterium]